MLLKTTVEQRGNCCVAWRPSPYHRYEDRYRLLPETIPVVQEAGRGALFAVFDGIGSAPRGMAAAQAMADCLLQYVTEGDGELLQMLEATNEMIHGWGYIEGTQRPAGACVGTVAHCRGRHINIYHCGDTYALLLREQREPRLLTRCHEINGVVNNYFGLGPAMIVETVQLELPESAYILLITDGVAKGLGATDAARLVRERIDRFGIEADALRALVDVAARAGSTDDVTALLIGCDVFELPGSLERR